MVNKFKPGDKVFHALIKEKYTIVINFFRHEKWYSVVGRPSNVLLIFEQEYLDLCKREPYTIEEWFGFMLREEKIVYSDEVYSIDYVKPNTVCLVNGFVRYTLTPEQLTYCTFQSNGKNCCKDED